MKYALLPVFIFCFFLLAFSDAAQAQNKYLEKKFQPFLTRGQTTWSIKGGMRKTDLDWNIALEETGTVTPNIFNEQTWTDILTAEVIASGRHVEPLDLGFVKGGLLVEGSVTLGYTVDGNGRLSSYLGDNRTLEFVRQTYNNTGGEAIGADITLGYEINLTGTPGYNAKKVMAAKTPRTSRGRMRQLRALNRELNRAGPYISVTPLVGYAADQQTYEREDAYQHIDTGDPDDPPVGYFHTESDFITNWYGPFAGLEGTYKTRRNMIRLRGQIHDVTYYGKGIEHSRADVLQQDPSYDQEGDGNSLLLNAEYAYALSEDTALTVDAMYRHREIEDGVYKIYPLNAEPTVRKLNEVSDTAKAVHVGLRYNW